MIGNDVIDLALAEQESNWQRKGFLDKLFTAEEQKLIHQSRYPTEMVWILWSRKEAVYKIIRQQNGTRGFYPLQIENIRFKAGQVCFSGQLFHVRTSVEKDCIHSIALQNQRFDKVAEVALPVELLKQNEIPYLCRDGKHIHVSKSHHGRFEKVVEFQ